VSVYEQMLQLYPDERFQKKLCTVSIVSTSSKSHLKKLPYTMERSSRNKYDTFFFFLFLPFLRYSILLFSLQSVPRHASERGGAGARPAGERAWHASADGAASATERGGAGASQPVRQMEGRMLSCSQASSPKAPSPRPCAGAMGKHRGRRTSKHAAGEREEQSPPGGKRMSIAARARHRRRGRRG